MLGLLPAASLSLLLVSVPVPAATPSLQLEKSVVLMRHGLRSPNQSPAELAKSATRPWPQWPVGPGELTEHGAALVRTLGGYYRQHYAAAGLLPAQGCPPAGSVANYADNAAARNPLSAQALMDGMFPGCGFKAAFKPQGEGVDPLFNPSGAGTCPISPVKARAAVLAAAGGELGRAVRRERDALKGLQAILKVRSSVTCADDVPSCGLDGFGNVIEDSKEGPKIKGGLEQAATLGENFLFAYMEGMPERDVAWGEAATPEALAPLLGPRNLYVQLLRKPPYLASRHVTALGRAILAALDDAPAAANPSLNATRFLAFMGRDIHLAAMSGLLGLEWSLPGQPDNTAPGVTLAFERLLNPADGKRYVRVVLYYQTLQQMRAGTTLDLAHPPGRVVLKVPGCEKEAVDGACPLLVLRARFTEAFAPDC
ncbi:MAG: histidine-type phosphatase [Panacagrimonas sp.]